MIIRGKNKKHGGFPCRIGEKFHKVIEEIKDARLRNGKSKERVSTEKITNLITRHNSWKEIFLNIVEASEEEVNEYGL